MDRSAMSGLPAWVAPPSEVLDYGFSVDRTHVPSSVLPELETHLRATVFNIQVRLAARVLPTAEC